MRFQLVSRADRREAMVEPAVSSSEATVVDEERGQGGSGFTGSTIFVLGPARCAMGAIFPRVRKDGRERLSMSTGLSPVRLILVSFPIGIHQSKSKSLRSAFKSIPTCKMGQ